MLIHNLTKARYFTLYYWNKEDNEAFEQLINELSNLFAPLYSIFIAANITEERLTESKEFKEFFEAAYEIKRKIFTKNIWNKK